MPQKRTYNSPQPLQRSYRYELPRNVFVAYSPRARRVLKFYSERDYRHWVLREVDPRFVSLCEYPDSGHIAKKQGDKLSFTFSLWTRDITGGEMYWHVPKPEDFIDDSVQLHEPRYWTSVRSWCDQRAIACQYVSPTALEEAAQYIDNWCQALPYVQHAHQHGRRRLEEELLYLIAQGRPVQLMELPAHFPELHETAVLAAVFHLLHQGKLMADMSQKPLNKHLSIEVNHASA